LRSQPDASIPVVFTDRPYGIGFDCDGWIESNTPEEYRQWFEPFWQEMVRVVEPGGAIIMWQSHHYLCHFRKWFPGFQLTPLCHGVRNVGRDWIPLVRWKKPGAMSRPEVTDKAGKVTGCTSVSAGRHIARGRCDILLLAL